MPDDPIVFEPTKLSQFLLEAWKTRIWERPMSGQSCGCDIQANHVCEMHRQNTSINPQTAGYMRYGEPASTTGGSLPAFTIKDSGKRESFAGGMVRDTADGKINYALVADGPMLVRWATHLTGGAKKYNARNWMLAKGDAEYERARESAFRHFMQWYVGHRDEDHASGVFFNINQAEYIRDNNAFETMVPA